MKSLSKALKKFLFAQKPDGRPKAGIGIYVLFLLVPFAIWMMAQQSEKAVAQAPGYGVSAPNLASAVRRTAEVEEEKRQSSLSDKGKLAAVKDTSHVADVTEGSQVPERRNALDLAVVEATKETEHERPVIDEEAASLPGSTVRSHQFGIAPSITPGGFLAREAGTSHSASGAGLAQLTVFRRSTAPAPAAAAPTVTEASRWAEGRFLPRGHYVPLYLLDTITTNDEQPIVTLAVARDVRFMGKVVIPFGTRLLAASGGHNPGKGFRVQLSVSSFQFPSGRELAVSGVIKGEDRASGLPAYYIPPPLWVHMQAYVQDFMAGYLDLLYLRQQNASRLQIGSVDVGFSQPAFDAKSEALSVTSTVIRDFAKAQMDELQARHAAHLVVPAGSVVWLQLLAPISLEDSGINVADMKAAPKPPVPAGGMPDPALMAQIQSAMGAMGNGP